MKRLRRTWKRLAGSITGARREADLADEIQSHIELLTDENVRRGMPAGEARRAALLTFGGVEATKERCRDQRGLPGIDSFFHDVRHSLRGVRRSPVFTAVAVSCIALGIGANIAVFSLFNAVMLRSLPVEDPGRLVFFQVSGQSGDISAVRRLSSGYGRASLPYAAYEELRDHARSLDGVFVTASAGEDGGGLTVGVDGRVVTADGEMVTASYFPVLGVSPVVGRAIIPEDLAPGAPNVAVISHAFWTRQFGADARAVGRGLTVNGLPFTVVGVAPRGFAGLLGAARDVWVPLRPTDDMRPWGSRSASPQVFFSDRRWWWCVVGGRLERGATRSQAAAEGDQLFRRSITAGVAAVPSTLPRLVAGDSTPVFETMRRSLSAPLRVVSGAAGLVLLIACTNLAALLEARGKSRQREIGVRLALGASRGRVVRQLLTESLLLALGGGAAGMLIALWAGPVLLRLLVGGPGTTPLDVAPDATVVAFGAVLSVVTGPLFGLVPALRATRAQPGSEERTGARWSTSRHRPARLLLGAQVALSVVMLFGTGLFVRTLRALEGQDLGFDRESLLLFEIDPERSGYKGVSGVALHYRLLEAIRPLPGVRSATFSQAPLLSGRHSSSPTGTDGAPLPAGQPNEVYYNRVGPEFFETMGIRVMLGRGVGWRSAGGARSAAVVSESWARAYFPGENPVGHRVSIGSDRLKPDQAYEIVGVVGDAKYTAMRAAAPRTVYLSYGADWDRSRRLCFAVRTASDPLGMVAPVRDAIRRIDSNLPLFNVKTQRQQIDEGLGTERMLAQISSCFGVLALLLVAVGVYGTLSYSVERRTAEIGICTALGAPRARVVWTFLRESLVIAGIGLAVGLPVALASARLVASSLFGVTVHDGPTIASTLIVPAAVAAFAGFLPANRASRIDPMRALRQE
jgi:predicted permease